MSPDGQNKAGSARAECCVCVVMHDVSPVTWPACKYLLDALGQVRQIPVTLLVVPAFHRGPAARHDAGFAGLLEQRLTSGDELALHGLHHLDDQPVAGIADRLRRRWYTAGEGEFAALSEANAMQRLQTGAEWFAARGWPLHGFVAPAWLMSAGTMQALRAMSFCYTTTLNHFILLPSSHAPEASFDTASLVYSVRSNWRRFVSRLWLDHLEAAHATQPVLRLGLHPADAAFPEVVKHWQHLLEHALETRIAVTKVDVANALRQGQLRSRSIPLFESLQISQIDSKPISAPKIAPAITSLG